MRIIFAVVTHVFSSQKGTKIKCMLAGFNKKKKISAYWVLAYCQPPMPFYVKIGLSVEVIVNICVGQL